MIEEFVDSGAVALLAIAVIVAELLALFFLRRARRSLFGLGFVANALSGGLLLMALRTALIDGSAVTVCLWLLASFVAHAADLSLRLRAAR